MQLSETPNRIWAEINLDALAHNYHVMCKETAPAKVMCVIKANAYGHGAVPCATALSAAGAEYFAVATPQEALQLRRHRFSQPILVLGPVAPQLVPQLAAQKITLAVNSVQTAKEYSAALGKWQRAKVHVKLDTGMGRFGILPEEAANSIMAISAIPRIKIDGLFTHFSVADDENEADYTASQLERFRMVALQLGEKGLPTISMHCANSAAAISLPPARAHFVRPGIMLYGVNPLQNSSLNLLPVLSLHGRITQVKQFKKGWSISYGRKWTAPRDSVIATVSAGYADGLMRCLSGKMHMLVNGQKAPQVGTICMDACMLDVTGIPDVKPGDTATIIGTNGGLNITADNVAQTAETIPYEILCGVGMRVPRMYLQGGNVLAEECYVDTL